MDSPNAKTSWLWWMLGASAFVVAGYWLTTPRLSAELDGLSTTERRALYRRTQSTLQTACVAASAPVLAGYCRDQAKFIEQFPECDEACRNLVDRFAPTPTR